MNNNDTKNSKYTERLNNLYFKRWKKILMVQKPYTWNIRRLNLGKTIDLGCGIGRYLEVLREGSVGIDHNISSINQIRSNGLAAFTPAQFKNSKYNKQKFDSILISHVLEHMSVKESLTLISNYLPNLKKGGKVIIICPQIKGYLSDASHVTFLDNKKLKRIANSSKLVVHKQYSFPFPSYIGKFFKYNEYITVAIKY